MNRWILLDTVDSEILYHFRYGNISWFLESFVIARVLNQPSKLTQMKNPRVHKNWVVASNIFYVQPYLGKIPILTNIFQMG